MIPAPNAQLRKNASTMSANPGKMMIPVPNVPETRFASINNAKTQTLAKYAILLVLMAKPASMGDARSASGRIAFLMETTPNNAKATMNVPKGKSATTANAKKFKAANAILPASMARFVTMAPA